MVLVVAAFFFCAFVQWGRVRHDVAIELCVNRAMMRCVVLVMKENCCESRNKTNVGLLWLLFAIPKHPADIQGI